MKHRYAVSPPLALVLAASAGLPAQSFALDAAAGDFARGVGRWQTVVDGVMGGRSTGRVRVGEDDALRFSGRISLENNGGFSQIRRPVEGAGFEGAVALEVECRGDGRTYKFDLRSRDARSMASAYQQDFPTAEGAWTTVRLPLDDFVLYSFGQRVRNAPALRPTRIESLGITLADKKEGAFELEIRSIRAVGPEPVAAAARGSLRADRGDGNGTPGGHGGGESRDLASVARAAGLTTLLGLVARAELALPEGESVTIFAPTNDAFAKLSAATLRQLERPEGRETLRRILGYHIAIGERRAAAVLNQRSLETLSGQPLTVDGATGTIAGAGLVAVDVPFDGGVVHVIDTVLSPEQRAIPAIAQGDERLSTLVAALRAADLVGSLDEGNGPWTVFAPVNAAFEALPEGALTSLLEPANRARLTAVLGLHVVPGRIAARELIAKQSLRTLMGDPLAVAFEGGKIRVGEGAKIVQGDIVCSNGVVHLIDRVLLPATPTADAAADSPRDLATAYAALYEAAVARGVPLFNGGDPEACAAVYEITLEAVLALAPDLDADLRDRLLRAKAAAEGQEPREQAWTLRRALDACYRRLDPGVGSLR